MKKITLLFLLVMCTVVAYPQIFKITDHDDNDVTNTTVTISGINYTLDQGFIIENLAPDSVDIMLKRYEINVIAGTMNYFCWGECFEPIDAGIKPVWYGPEAIRLGNGQTNNSAHVYHVHQGKPGESTYLYVFYDDNNPDDSAWVEVVFDVPQYVGVNELSASDVQMSAGPIPASDVVTINYELKNFEGGKANIVVADLLGKKKGVYPIQRKKGNVQVDVTGYLPGIYFYSIQVGDRLISTQKMVVK